MTDDVDERFQIDERFKDEEFDREFVSYHFIQFLIIQIQDQKNDQRPVVKSFQRFDPDDPGHLAWMEANKDEVVSGKKSKAFDVEEFNNVN